MLVCLNVKGVVNAISVKNRKAENQYQCYKAVVALA